MLKAGKPLGYLTQPIVWDNDQYIPLHHAAAGDLEVVEELVEKHDIPVGVRTGGCKRTPLHLAALEGNLEVIQKAG